MSIEDHQVLCAIVVRIEEAGSEPGVILPNGLDAGAGAEMLKSASAAIAKQSVCLIDEVRDEDGEISAPVKIGGIDAHTAVRHSVLIPRDAARHAHLRELS